MFDDGCDFLFIYFLIAINHFIVYYTFSPALFVNTIFGENFNYKNNIKRDICQKEIIDAINFNKNEILTKTKKMCSKKSCVRSRYKIKSLDDFIKKIFVPNN